MPQSLPFVPRITQAGLNAAVSAAGLQLSVQVTHIAIGTGLYNPTGLETALVNRRLTSPIAGGGKISPTQLRLHASFQAAPGGAFSCGEVGFYLGHPDTGGILLALYSTTDAALQPIVYVSDRFLVTNSYTLGLSALPAGSVTVLVDQNAQAMLLLMGNHEIADDPHGDRKFAAMADQAHVEAPHPHSQYLRSTDLDAIAIYTLKKNYGGGGVYTTYDDTRNPNEIFGFGTWALCGIGRVFVGQNAADPDFETVGQQGGAKEVAISEPQLPKHKHRVGSRDAGGADTGGDPVQEFVADYGYAGTGAAAPVDSEEIGNDEPHNNLQPYEVVRKWRCLSVNNPSSGGSSGGGTPSAFAFAPAYNQAQSATVTSNTITISGMSAAGAISVSGGQYRIGSAAATSSGGVINNGDTLRLVATASSAYQGTTAVVVTIGSFSTTWQVTTQSAPGVDTVPDAFSFASQTGLARNATATSAVVTVAGINAPAPISVTGGTYSINGGAYTASPGTISNGNTVRVQMVTPSTGLTSATATLTIGGVSGTFTATTAAASAFNMTASPNPVNASRDIKDGPGTISSTITLNVVNGTTPYTTTITLIENVANASSFSASVISPTQVRVQSSGFNQTTRQGVFRITLTDAVGNSISRDVPVNHEYFNSNLHTGE